MSPFLQLAFELVVILLAAKAAGYISTRLGQPSVLGELLIGLLLGPSLINILHLSFINSGSLGATTTELSELGVLLLMFIAGLELHLGELAGHRKVSLLASIGGAAHCRHPFGCRRSGPAGCGPAGRPAGGPDRGADKICRWQAHENAQMSSSSCWGI
jgi:hypothetical protein